MPSAPPVPDRRTPAPAPPDKAAADPAAARGANAAKAPAQSGAPGPGTAPAKPAGAANAKPAGAANAGTAGAAKAGTADKAQTTPGARGAQAAPQPGAVARADQLAVRAKLAVSQPGDASEREADAVADRVSRQWDPAAGRTGGVSGVSGGKPGAGPAGPAAKRPEAGAAPVARAPDEPAPSAKEPAARSEAGAEPVHGPTGPLQVDAQPIQQRRGLCEPLPEGVRQQMESQLGHDLSAVRVHHDEQAQQLCRSLRAQAFTSGDDVFFAAGRYQPNSRAA